jgi:arylsulfatase A-like enzyme
VIALFFAGCAAPPSPPRGPPNVLLVSLDTVRADHTSAYGYDRDTTPVLAALAAEGTTFDNAFSNGNESAWSHAALFTGRYASELATPIYATYGIPDAATLVSEGLQASGYATAMFSAGGHVTADFGFDQGWDHFSAQPGFGSLFETGPRAAKWIEAVPDKKPWFVFLHGYDAHRPYTRTGPWDHLYADAAGSALAEAVCRSPCLSEMVLGDTLFPELVPDWFTHTGGAQIMATQAYDRLAGAGPDAARVPFPPADRAHVVAHYDGALRHADTLLGLTLQRLDRGGHLGNTVVIVLSDHGEDLMDHGYMNHRTGLFDSCTKVPLVAWGPGFTAGQHVSALVDGRDVAATIVAAAGVVPPAGSGGRDLRAVAAGTAPATAVFAEGVMDMVTVRTPTHRLVYRGGSLASADFTPALRAAPIDGTAFSLYDLRSDPGEQAPLQDPATAAALRDVLVTWREGLRAGDFVLPEARVSPEVARALREHGYWGPEAALPGSEAARPEAPAEPVKAPTPTSAPFPIDDSCSERLPFLAAP